ncbi:uncharacterized protein LOC127000979 [Eriocheir sinensis]|uniref:uncharacterized protein LOC127000979 n=1 Tax=Eriocheir sinensis TaxID=95602 RepID=UPI0021CAB6A3|nr:uncharacterized protein LOC127000979 [Eriocheir sinensis]
MRLYVEKVKKTTPPLSHTSRGPPSSTTRARRRKGARSGVTAAAGTLQAPLELTSVASSRTSVTRCSQRGGSTARVAACRRRSSELSSSTIAGKEGKLSSQSPRANTNTSHRAPSLSEMIKPIILKMKNRYCATHTHRKARLVAPRRRGPAGLRPRASRFRAATSLTRRGRRGLSSSSSRHVTLNATCEPIFNMIFPAMATTLVWWKTTTLQMAASPTFIHTCRATFSARCTTHHAAGSQPTRQAPSGPTTTYGHKPTACSHHTPTPMPTSVLAAVPRVARGRLLGASSAIAAIVAVPLSPLLSSRGPCQMQATVVIVLVLAVCAQGQESGSSPRAACPWPCPEYYHPVCGSNGVTYDNPCKLYEAAACVNHCITQRHTGKCDSPCPEACIAVYQPVCGTDGRTYSSACHLSMERCANPCVEMKHDGECVSPGEQCREMCVGGHPVCGSDGATYMSDCHLSNAACDNPCIKKVADGQCSRTCGDICPVHVDDASVCGSDGITYESVCHLQEAACQNPCITLQHLGPCITCPIICPLNFAPVCGTDGKTYSNRCQLDAAACTNPCIALRAEGACLRVCGDACPVPASGNYVCGSDGTTYPSQCHLQEAACQNPCLVLEREGPCEGRDCPGICPFNFDPVCGSDGKTYGNMCQLNDATHCENSCITLRGVGPCGRNCGDLCPMTNQVPVCGSDDTTYPSQCHLEEAACQNPCLTLQHEGACGEGRCCLEGMLSLPDLNVQLSCHAGALLAEPISTTTPTTATELPTNVPHCLFAGRGYPVGARLDHLCFPIECTSYGWAYMGQISDCCRHCHLHGDMHVFTFDHQLYNFNGTCNYTVAQQGASFTPPLGVFTWPKTCKGRSTCFRHTTFRNDEHTIVTVNHYGLFKVNVNGYENLVAESGVQVLRTGDGAAVPVLAWRGDCGIYLAGSSGIVLLACLFRLDVWASSSLVDHLDGLCGHYNLNPNDDFRARDGTTYPSNNWPLAFPHSWRTNVQTEAHCHQPHTGPINGDDPCPSNPKWRSIYQTTCMKMLDAADGLPTTQMANGFTPPVYDTNPYINTCAADVCVMHQGGFPVKAMEQWIFMLRQNLVVSLKLGQRLLGSDGSTTIDPTGVAPHCMSTTTPDQCTSTATTTVTASILATTTHFSTTTVTTTTTTSITTTTTTFITIVTSPTYPSTPYTTTPTTNPYPFPTYDFSEYISSDYPFPSDFYQTTLYTTTHTTPIYKYPLADITFPYITEHTSYPTHIPTYSKTFPTYHTPTYSTTFPTYTYSTYTSQTPTYHTYTPTYSHTFPTYPYPSSTSYTPSYPTPTPPTTHCTQKDCPNRCAPAGQCPQGMMELPWPYLCEGECVCCI